MKKNKLPRLAMLCSMVWILICSACSAASLPPEPQSAAGVYVRTGFEYYRWEEGLRLMVWIEGIESSGCNMTTSEREYRMACHALANNETRFEWQLITRDGKNAEFSIAGQAFDLAEGNVFILEFRG